MSRFKDQAVCIRLIDWSETSQIVALLMREHGIVRGIAKGSKRFSPSSIQRFSGGIELLTGGQVLGSIKPSTDLASITEWDLQQPNWHLRRDLAAQRLGLYAADLIGAMLPPHDAHPRIFDAMVRFLTAIVEPTARPAALLHFQWRLLDDCGYKPELHTDVHSGDALNAARSYTFDARGGGITRGQANDRDAWKVRKQTVDLLRAIEQKIEPHDESQTASDAMNDAASLTRANRLLCVYARAILDRELPTMKHVMDA